MEKFKMKKTLNKAGAVALGLGAAMIIASSAKAGLQEQMKGVKSLVVDNLAPIALTVSAIVGGGARAVQGNAWGGLAVAGVIMLVGFAVGFVNSEDFLKVGAFLTGSSGSDG